MADFARERQALPTNSVRSSRLPSRSGLRQLSVKPATPIRRAARRCRLAVSDSLVDGEVPKTPIRDQSTWRSSIQCERHALGNSRAEREAWRP